MPSPASAAFISYARADSAFALRLARDLKAAGAAVWLDQLDIRPGQSWDDAVEAALRTTPQMLILLSPTSVASNNVRDEIAYALEQGKTIVPILIETCDVPLRLQRKQRIDFTPSYDTGLQSLLAYLGANLPTSSVPKVTPVADSSEDPNPAPASSFPASPLGPAPTTRLKPLPSHPPASNRTLIIGGAVALLVAIAVTLFLVLKPSFNPAASTQQALDSYKQGQFAQAAVLYQKACNQGSPLACANLGLMYHRGEGLPQDDSKALKLFRKACDAGEANGCAGLGDAYNFGQGISPDKAQAATFYDKACNGNVATACTDLGVLYEHGDGVNHDYSAAVKLYDKACQAGEMTGCSNLGVIYENGFGGATQDKSHALALYRQACDGGYQPACSAIVKLSVSTALGQLNRSPPPAK